MTDKNKICGCKGIRTCLLCEKLRNTVVEPLNNKQESAVYTFCPHCNLCWPDGNSSDQSPLYLGKLRLILEFLSSEEEANAVLSIDKMAWLPSQSGRRKQDFGPKVNFKKKKSKIGDFVGFPRFAETILKKFKDVAEVFDFKPVELCHLEYTPEMGSAIDPHIDDSWIWGERLVTVNLSSSTVLQLTPAVTSSCNCAIESKKFCQIPRTLKSKANHSCSDSSTADCNSTPCLSQETCSNSHTVCVSPDNEMPTGFREVKDMCGLFRNDAGRTNAVVRVVLPPRSLLVLAGCARHNWFHEIQRNDVKSRRLAMTFRELSSEFLEGGTEKEIGNQLLSIASNFSDFD